MTICIENDLEVKDSKGNNTATQVAWYRVQIKVLKAKLATPDSETQANGETDEDAIDETLRSPRARSETTS